MKRFKIFKNTETIPDPCLRAGIKLAIILCLVLSAVNVSFAETATEPARVSVLTGTQPSMEKLCIRMLEILHKKDKPLLRAITITENEFKQVIWPQLPISRVEQWKTRLDFVWSQHYLKSSTCLEDLIFGQGGRKFTFLEIKTDGEITDYNTYKVHRNIRMLVMNEQGKKREVNFFGSIIEMQDQYKIMSYNVH